MTNWAWRAMARPSVWIALSAAIALTDLLTPPLADLCVLQAALLPLAWRILHRRYMPLLTGVLMIATVLPGLAWVLLQPAAAPGGWGASPASAAAFDPARLWTLVTLAGAGAYYDYLQRRRKQRLRNRRDLQARVRRRTLQLKRVNQALRNEIAHRLSAQQRLARSEAHLQSLVDRMQLRVIRKDCDGLLTFANDHFCQEMGKRPDELIGCTDAELYPESLAAQYRADDQRVMETGETIEHVESHPRPGGEACYVQVFKAPDLDHAGRCVGVQIMYWDVTERYARLVEQRRSEARKRALFEAASDAILLVDRADRVVEANPAAAALLRYGPSELVGRNLPEVVAPVVTPGQTRRRWVDLPRGQRRETTLVRGDGSTFDAEVSVHAIPLEESHGLAIIMRDVTERRQALRVLRQAKQAAEEASRAKSQFLAGVSHEIRTPLGGITGLRQLLAATPLSPRGRQYLELMGHSIELLSGVIEDILDFSKIEAGRIDLEPAVIDLHRCVGDAFQCLAARAVGKGLELVYSVDPAVPRWVIADAKRLRQVVVNLTGNAVKFTEAGAVHVRLSAPATDGDGRAKPAVVLLSVTDTGIGIPRDRQAEIFEAFHQGDSGTTRRFGGTGLGLAICDGLVRRMGGRIDVRSSPNRGSTFECRLPLEIAASGGAESEATAALADGGGRTALVVFPHRLQRRAIAEALTMRHWQVRQRSSGKTVDLQRAGLVVADVEAPGMAAAAKAIDARRLIWVGRLGAAPPFAIDADDTCLVKPVSPDDLIAAVARRLTPMAAAPASSAAGRPLADHHQFASPLRLLVVDDSAVNRTVIRDLLTGVGHQVQTACNGAEAVQAARDQHFDCLLMDLQMPEMDGVAAALQIRDEAQARGRTPAPVIALTAHVTDDHRRQCLAAGMQGFVTKPVSLDDLLEAVQALTDPQEANWRQHFASVGGHDDQTITAMADAFLMEVPSLCQSLEAALQVEDTAGVRRIAHTLKSCFRYVESPQSTQGGAAAAAEIEEAAIADQLETAAQHLANVQEAARHWCQRVRTLLPADHRSP